MASSCYHHDYPQLIPQDFSTLEATPQTLRHDESFKELPAPLGLEVLSPDAVHLSNDARHSHWDAPEVAYSPQSSPKPQSLSSPLPASSFDGSSGGLMNEKDINDNYRAQRRICGWASKTFWPSVALAALTIAVVVGLAIGLTVGLQNVHRKHEKVSNSPSSQTSSTATGINNGSILGVSNSSSLAAIAFNDTLGVLHHRVYYQDDAGKIKELSWNASTKLWQVSNPAIGQAKMNTPLAAIVTGPPQYAFQINIYAINDTGALIGWASKDTNFGSSNTSFTPAPIGSQGIIPDTSSDLAAVWDRGCKQCSFTLNLLYQGGNGQVIYGNLSGTEWFFNPVPISPVRGTGLALDIRFLADGGRDIVLYHQTAAGNLSYAIYNGTYNSTGAQWMLNKRDPLNRIPTNAPIASFAYGYNPDGSTILEEVFSSGINGTTYQEFTPSTADWSSPQTPSAMSLVQNSTSLAANTNAHVYALEGGAIAEFAMNNGNGGTWSLIGNVKTS